MQMNTRGFGGLGYPTYGSHQTFSEYRDAEVENQQTSQRAVNEFGNLLDYPTLELRVHPPNVDVHHDKDQTRHQTRVTVDSANRPGTLVEVVQCLTELGLDISRSRITSDGGWFVDEFNVREPGDRPVTCLKKLATIQKVLNVNFEIDDSIQAVEDEGCGASTVLQLAGQDRAGLLADVTAMLVTNGCAVWSAAVWTYKQRVAFVLSVTESNAPLADSAKRERLHQLLVDMMDTEGNSSLVRMCDVQKQRQVHHERKLHLLLLTEELRAYDHAMSLRLQVPEEPSQAKTTPDQSTDQPRVTVTFAQQSRYWFVTIQCVDRSKLLFDTVCTLADMDYDVYHAAIDSSLAPNGSMVANQEFYIRPRLGMAEWDAVKADKLRSMLRAAIMRRFPRGLKMSLQCTQGLDLAQLAQELKANDLTITRARVKPQDLSYGGHTFYVMNSDGTLPAREAVERACFAVGGTYAEPSEVGGSKRESPLDGTHHSFSFAFMERKWRAEWGAGSPGSEVSCSM